MFGEFSKENLEKITATKKNAKNGRASIHVVSESKIQVSISHHDGYSMDATTAMPITSGGHHYMISSWVETTRANIINTGGRTIVRIIPGLDPDGVPYGPEQAVLLEEGEVAARQKGEKEQDEKREEEENGAQEKD